MCSFYQPFILTTPLGFAMLELKILMVRIFNKFKFTLDPEMLEPAVKMFVTIKADVKVRMYYA